MGSNGSTSASTVIPGWVRADTYNQAASALSKDATAYGGDYKAPAIERLGEGDYSKVRDGLNASTTRQQDLGLQASDQAMSDRGIYTSLNALRANNDVRERYAPQFAANDATTMQMKATDIAGVNAANMENANRTYDASWRPADYKAGLWNGTGGTVSSGNSGGWSI
jgi:hypothetical protein